MPSPSTTVAVHEPWMLGPFTRIDDANPVLIPDREQRFRCPLRGEEVRWEEKDVFNPAAVTRDGKVYLLYRAEDSIGRFMGTSRIGLAVSDDGLRFAKHPTPVLYPERDAQEVYEWEGGCEDPRVVEADDGRFVMLYSSFDGACARLCVATSSDLYSWTKHGLAFEHASDGAYRHRWSKSGAVVCRRDGERLVAARIDGRYWMYWGESDVFCATSDDLIRWTPVESIDATYGRLALVNGRYIGQPVHQPSRLKPVFSTRAHRFDVGLVEPGPPAVLGPDGIHFIYNSANRVPNGDQTLPEGTYAPAQVLLDPLDPTIVLRRSRAPFMIPERPYEITGQTGNTCFAQGLVRHRGRWLMYYGTADSRIAVAAAPG